MSRRDLGHVQTSVQDAHTYLNGEADRDLFSRFNLSKPSASSVLEKGRKSAAVGVGALGAGYLQGRANTVNLFGTPVPTGVAIALTAWLGGFLGEHYLGGFSEDLYNIGDGALASWATVLGMQWGQNARVAAGESTGPIMAGRSPHAMGGAHPLPRLSPPSNIPRPLTEAEVVALYRRRR